MRDAATGERPLAQHADRELRRLREELYRASPPPGAVERYSALLERHVALQPPEPGTAEPSAAVPSRRRRRRRRRWPLLIAGAVAVVAVSAGAVVAVAPPARRPDAAEVLTTAGPYAVTDRDALASLLRPGATDGSLLIRAVQGSELPQLAVWDDRSPGVWVQQGRGDLRRRFDGQRTPSTTLWPFSVIMRCAGSGRYRWTILGTTAARPAVHVLETATAACGAAPTVATFTRPVGATVRGFDLTVGRDVRWGMAFVYALDRS